MHYVRFIAAFLVYTIIDVGWNLSPIALSMYDNLHESSGSQEIRDMFGKAPETWGRRRDSRSAGVSTAHRIRQQLLGYRTSDQAEEPNGRRAEQLRSRMRRIRHLHRPNLRRVHVMARHPSADRHPHRRTAQLNHVNRHHLRGTAKKRGIDFRIDNLI